MHVVIPAVIALIVPLLLLSRGQRESFWSTFDQAGASLPGVRVAN